jgi:hypothetical protein
MTVQRQWQLVHLNADGTYSNFGPPIVVQESKRRRLRQFNDDQWTTGEACACFKRYLFRKDRAGLEAVIRALDRLDCWSQAVHQLRLSRPTETHAQTLVSFWIERGLYSIPMGLRDDMPDLIDAFRRFIQPYQGPTVTLYRGELETRYAKGVCGIAWTTSLRTAEMFARRRVPLQEGPGVVLKIEATAEVIVADLKQFSTHATNIGEDEYIVDPRLIQDMISVVG